MSQEEWITFSDLLVLLNASGYPLSWFEARGLKPQWRNGVPCFDRVEVDLWIEREERAQRAYLNDTDGPAWNRGATGGGTRCF